MDILLFLLYALLMTINMYVYLIFARTLYKNFELVFFKKTSHYIIFIVLCILASSDSFGFKIYDIIPLSVHIILSFLAVIVLFVYVKFDVNISWKDTFLGLLVYTTLSIIIDAGFSYSFYIGGLDLGSDLVCFYLQYLGTVIYSFMFLSFAFLIDYFRKPKETRVETTVLPKINISHFSLAFYISTIGILFIIFIVYRIYITQYELDSFEYNWTFVFFVFALSAFVVFILLRQYKKQQQELHIKALENETKNLTNYTKTVDNLYIDIRSYKHDIQNILLGIRTYIDEDNMDDLKNFYYSDILSLSPLNNSAYQIISSLQPLKHISLKGLVFSKIEDTVERNIHFQVEMLEPIEQISMNSVDLCRVVGILLDNAIESASECDDKWVILSFDIQDGNTIIAVQNSFMVKPDLELIYQPNYSTKGKERGMGLPSLKAVLSKYENASLSCRLDGLLFRSTLEIGNVES